MTRVYIVRHGETEWNREGRFQGWKDSPLTEKGREQVEYLAERLKDHQIDYLYSSPSGRTIETAEVIANANDLEIIEEQGFKEINLGELEGKRSEWIEANHPDVIHDFWNDPENYEPISGEDFYELRERVIGTLNDLIRKHSDDHVLIVSHAAASKTILSHFEERELRGLWDPPEVKAASLSMVDIKGYESDIKLYGDTSHYSFE
ncbi:MAG: histidine phosphatase family protein [Thermoplasmatota archaeon]